MSVVPTLTLAGFVSERLGEREAAALAVQTSSLEVSGASMMELAAARQLLDPAAVLASVEADRRILALHEVREPGLARPVCRTCWNDQYAGLEGYPCPTLLALAAAYGTPEPECQRGDRCQWILCPVHAPTPSEP